MTSVWVGLGVLLYLAVGIVVAAISAPSRWLRGAFALLWPVIAVAGVVMLIEWLATLLAAKLGMEA